MAWWQITLPSLFILMTPVNLYIPETYDLSTLRIEDNSIYSQPATNAILEIRTPVDTCFIVFNEPFDCKSISLNCINLKLCTSNCSGSGTHLPDGIYDIKYSVNPNLFTMVEFFHFRTTSITKRLASTLCTFFSKKCDYKKSEYNHLLNELMEIHFLITGAKWKAEECLEKSEALALYESAVEKLNNFDNGSCCY